MITENLLSKVLKIDKRLLRIYKTKENYIFFYTMSNVGESENYINVYELAYKCKEWAFDNGYELRSGRDIDVKEELCYFCEYKQERQLDYANGDYFLADTETESIFKACQWILDNKEG